MQKKTCYSAMDSLSKISSTENLQLQLKDIYKKLENMHDNRRKIESTTNII